VLDRNAIAHRYLSVRAETDAIAAPLSSEDMLVQSMPDASPTKWHLAHTTWFFEEFVLAKFVSGHVWEDRRWRVLFNSYYESVGPSHARPARGLLSRPSLDEIRAWRARVDERVLAFLPGAEPAALAVALLGTHHEQQHQELMLTDVKHALFGNPLRPSYAPRVDPPLTSSEHPRDRARKPWSQSPAPWFTHEEGIVLVGHDGDDFSFDNERPRHPSFVGSFSISSRLVTNGEYACFIEEGGYDRAEFWLSAGFSESKGQGWVAPLYWERGDGTADWHTFTLHGIRVLEAEAPVVHLSFYEADAYARWAGARLPTEEEWEAAAADVPVDGNFVESGLLTPTPALANERHPTQLFGDAWEWTASAYLPYPRFQPLQGALGEYNGKFMSGQMTLRGGSCLSPQSHLRTTYRNYFAPPTRWQMTGLRLARDI
jgi:ergothioneine biosynthesis protein EgtB